MLLYLSFDRTLWFLCFAAGIPLAKRGAGRLLGIAPADNNGTFGWSRRMCKLCREAYLLVHSDLEIRIIRTKNNTRLKRWE